MDFALDEVLLWTFWRFWTCGHLGGEKKKTGIEDGSGEVK